MTRYNIKKIVCSACNKTQEYSQSTEFTNLFGNSPPIEVWGWLYVERPNGIKYDFCSEECLVSFFRIKKC